MISPSFSKLSKLPTEFIDAHHHFMDTNNNSFQSFLAQVVPNETYRPEQYDRDVVKSLSAGGVNLIGSVHVESMPDDGVKEAAWVDSLSSSVKAIVGSCDLSSATVDVDLQRLKEASTLVRGVRWILDCVGPFEPGTATHVATTRHNGIDYLRGSNGGYDGEVVPSFEFGYSLLEKHNLSFDLQCAPAQLLQASKLCAKYPNIPVCLDHLGKPRMILGSDDSKSDVLKEGELQIWRQGMRTMADLPHVYVKMSMLGYAIPGWCRTPEKVNMMMEIVREVVEMFGPNRCMVALNWWKDESCSDSDGLSDVGPSPLEFLQYLSDFFHDYSDEDRQRLFAVTAKEFYRI